MNSQGRIPSFHTLQGPYTLTPTRSRSGKALLFGGLCGAPITSRPSRASPAHQDDLYEAQRLGYAIVNVPVPVKSLAAGVQHVVLSDGERVWAVGRWLDGAGLEAGAAPFYAPAELLHLPAEGIVKVLAGQHAMGAISGDGRLFVSGRLLDRHHAEAVSGAGGGGRWGMLMG